ncbi:MAG: ferritin-like domain-containing protein [Caldilineaceae bacterium]
MGTLAASSLGTGHAYAQSGNATIDVLNYALTPEHLESRAYSEVLAASWLADERAIIFQAFGAHEGRPCRCVDPDDSQYGRHPSHGTTELQLARFQSQEEVITYFQVVEELGAAAYLGQAPKLVGGGGLLTATVVFTTLKHNMRSISRSNWNFAVTCLCQPKTMAEVLAVVGPILEQGEMPTQMPSTGLVDICRAVAYAFLANHGTQNFPKSVTHSSRRTCATCESSRCSR